MSDIEKAYNLAVETCAALIEAASKVVAPEHGVTSAGLKDLADSLRGLMRGDEIIDQKKEAA